MRLLLHLFTGLVEDNVDEDVVIGIRPVEVEEGEEDDSDEGGEDDVSPTELLEDKMGVKQVDVGVGGVVAIDEVGVGGRVI